MDDKPESATALDPADRFAALADEIRGLSQDVSDSLFKVLTELRKSNPGNVYVASKRYIERFGFLLTDGGCLGISDRFVEGEGDAYLFSPADIVIHMMPDKLETGDILLAFGLNKGGIWTYHCRLLRFDPRGSIEIQDLADEKTYWIAPDRILGKLAVVIRFGTPEWHSLIGQLITPSRLADSLSKHVKRLEEGGPPDRSRRQDELRRRLAVLTSSTR